MPKITHIVRIPAATSRLIPQRKSINPYRKRARARCSSVGRKFTVSGRDHARKESYRYCLSWVRRRGTLDKPSPYLCSHCLANITCTATPSVRAREENQTRLTRTALDVGLNSERGGISSPLDTALRMSCNADRLSSNCSFLYDSTRRAAKTALNRPAYTGSE